jgi:tripartite-type tricarboxylate transporter receptor subunit TctC
MRVLRPLLFLYAALAVVLLAGSAAAQTYPAKPIRLICPFPPGGVADVVARVMAQRMSESLGQPVVVENRTGASGTIGVDVVVKAPADGYTLLMTTGDFITVPSMMPPMQFEPRTALIPITMVATAPLILLGNADAPFKSVKELVAAAKAAPGKIAFSSPGTGTINHLAAEWLAIDAGVKLLHAPYRGGAPAAVAIANGEVQLGVVTQPSAVTHVQSGKARVIGVMTRDKPAFLGDMPTIAETGMPSMDASLFVGLFAPAKTPDAIVNRLNQELAAILKDPEIRKRLNSVGVEANGINGKAFVDHIAAGADRYAKIIQATGIKPER